MGVAAGLPNHSCSPPRDIRLGNVIVAYSPPSGDPPAIVPYGLGKQKGGNNFELPCHGHSLPQTKCIVGSAIGKLKAENQEAQVIGYYRDILDTAAKFPDPGQENDFLYLSNVDRTLNVRAFGTDRSVACHPQFGMEMGL
ncbi:hypothetical protein BDV09DRAFT_181599 [Aspergillus tetrazonus]